MCFVILFMAPQLSIIDGKKILEVPWLMSQNVTFFIVTFHRRHHACFSTFFFITFTHARKYPFELWLSVQLQYPSPRISQFWRWLLMNLSVYLNSTPQPVRVSSARDHHPTIAIPVTPKYPLPLLIPFHQHHRHHRSYFGIIVMLRSLPVYGSSPNPTTWPTEDTYKFSKK